MPDFVWTTELLWIQNKCLKIKESKVEGRVVTDSHHEILPLISTWGHSFFARTSVCCCLDMASPMCFPLKSMSLHTDPYWRLQEESCKVNWWLYHGEIVLSMSPRNPHFQWQELEWEHRFTLCTETGFSYELQENPSSWVWEELISASLWVVLERNWGRNDFWYHLLSFSWNFNSVLSFPSVILSFILISNHLNHLSLAGSPSSNCSVNANSLKGI